MSSRFVDWNKINDEDSSEQSQHGSDNQPYQFKGSEKQIKSQSQQEKTVPKKDLQQPKSPKFNNKRKVADIIQQQLAKIEKDKRDKVWLYARYDQTQTNQEISAVLQKIKQIEQIKPLRQNKGWNILLKKEDAIIFVRQGMKQQRGWCKFQYSTMNQPKPDYYKSSQPSNNYAIVKKKFVEKSQINVKQIIQEDSIKLQIKNPKEQQFQETTSKIASEKKKLQQFKQDQSKLLQKVIFKQKSQFQEKKNIDQGKKKKYVAKQLITGEQASLMVKKTVSLATTIEKKEEKQQKKKQEHQQQKNKEKQEIKKEINSPAKKKKKNKQANKQVNKNKQSIFSNNPFNSLKTY